MSTTTKSLVYAVWRRLSNGNITDDSQYTYRELRLHVRSAIAEALKINYYEVLNNTDLRQGDDSVSATYQVDVQTEVTTGLKYINLPAEPVSIAGGRSVELHDENPLSVYATEFIPMTSSEMFLSRYQPPIPCTVPFYTSGNKIYIAGIYDKEKVNVTQRYALPVNDDDDLNLSPDYEKWVVQSVLEVLAPKLVENDRQNNGVDDTK